MHTIIAFALEYCTVVDLYSCSLSCSTWKELAFATFARLFGHERLSDCVRRTLWRLSRYGDGSDAVRLRLCCLCGESWQGDVLPTWGLHAHAACAVERLVSVSTLADRDRSHLLLTLPSEGGRVWARSHPCMPTSYTLEWYDVRHGAAALRFARRRALRADKEKARREERRRLRRTKSLENERLMRHFNTKLALNDFEEGEIAIWELPLPVALPAAPQRRRPRAHTIASDSTAGVVRVVVKCGCGRTASLACCEGRCGVCCRHPQCPRH